MSIRVRREIDLAVGELAYHAGEQALYVQTENGLVQMRVPSPDGSQQAEDRDPVPEPAPALPRVMGRLPRELKL